MPTPEYELGQTQHAEGKAIEANPFPESEAAAHEDWMNGWQDAAAAAGAEDGASTAETPPPAETPPAADQGDSEEPSAVEVVNSLGDVGYERIMELLGNPPLDDLPDGVNLPPNGEVPEDLSGWLEAWKQPLSFVAVDTALNVVKTRISGTSRGRLKELYRGMSPAAMTAAMNANAAAVAEFADQRVAEAGMIASMQAMVTQKAASYLLTALTLV